MASDEFEGTHSNGNGDLTIVQLDEPNESTDKSVGYKEGIMEIPEETINAFDGDELRARVFYEKYALRDLSGRIVERTPDQMWLRVAREIASSEKTQKLKQEWEDNFYWLLSDFRFIPGGGSYSEQVKREGQRF